MTENSQPHPKETADVVIDLQEYEAPDYEAEFALLLERYAASNTADDEAINDLVQKIETSTTEEDIEVLASMMMDIDEDCVNRQSEIVRLRKSGGDRKNLVAEQKTAFEKYIDIASYVTGVSLEKDRQKVVIEDFRLKYKEKFDSLGDNPTEEEVFEAFMTETGYPATEEHEPLIPSFITELMYEYMGYVRHQSVISELPNEMYSNEEVREVDVMRSKLHTATAEAVESYLQFKEWEHDDYRWLIQKCVEKCSSRWRAVPTSRELDGAYELVYNARNRGE